MGCLQSKEAVSDTPGPSNPGAAAATPPHAADVVCAQAAAVEGKAVSRPVVQVCRAVVGISVVVSSAPAMPCGPCVCVSVCFTAPLRRRPTHGEVTADACLVRSLCVSLTHACALLRAAHCRTTSSSSSLWHRSQRSRRHRSRRVTTQTQQLWMQQRQRRSKQQQHRTTLPRARGSRARRCWCCTRMSAPAAWMRLCRRTRLTASTSCAATTSWTRCV